MKKMSRGFTLFEVLIALAVVVILMGTLSSTMTIAFKQKRAAEDAVESVRNTQTVGDIFCQDVQCIAPPNPLSADANSAVYLQYVADISQTDLTSGNSAGFGGIQGMNINGTAAGGSYLFGPFRGDNISLSFYSLGDEDKAPSSAGVRYIEYRLSQQPDGRQALVRSADSNLLSDTQNANLPEEVLITGVAAISFQYYDGTGWADSWDSSSSDGSNMLPFAVKMELTLEPIHDGAAQRIITRCATIWCAQKTVSDYNTAENDASTTDTTGGITGGITLP